MQFAVQAPSVRRLGFSLLPLWNGFKNPQVKAVLLLMLPGIPVLGINQINQLVSNRFASFIDSGVSYTYGAYRVTELVFGAVVVQLTTVLLPLLYVAAAFGLALIPVNCDFVEAPEDQRQRLQIRPPMILLGRGPASSP